MNKELDDKDLEKTIVDDFWLWLSDEVDVATLFLMDGQKDG